MSPVSVFNTDGFFDGIIDPPELKIRENLLKYWQADGTFFQTVRPWRNPAACIEHCCVKKIIRRGHSMPVSLTVPLQAFVAIIMKIKSDHGNPWKK